MRDWLASARDWKKICSLTPTASQGQPVIADLVGQDYLDFRAVEYTRDDAQVFVSFVVSDRPDGKNYMKAFAARLKGDPPNMCADLPDGGRIFVNDLRDDGRLLVCKRTPPVAPTPTPSAPAVRAAPPPAQLPPQAPIHPTTHP